MYIGRRLMNPRAALVKQYPNAIGADQYQTELYHTGYLTLSAPRTARNALWNPDVERCSGITRHIEGIQIR